MPTTLIPELAPDIIFAHKDWVLLHKPTGFSVQDLSIAYQPHFPEFHPVHRIDKETSGLWLIALNADANQILSQCFQEKTVTKAYLAIVDATKIKKKQGRIIGDMEKSRRKSWRLSKTKNKPAQTHFQSVSLNPGLRLVWLTPLTGKTHQLRVAMKSNGSAIVGDDIYALESSAQFDRLYLHAYALSFIYKGKHFDFVEPVKSGKFFLDNDFSEAFKQLQIKVQAT